MRTSAETARHARIRRAVGLVLAVAGRPSRVRLVVAMLAVVSLLSAGGALQHASARSPESLSERDTVKPSAPELLRVTDTAESSLTLAWSASSDDVGVAGYEVRRSDSRRAERVTTTTYLLVNLMCGQTYDLSVVAYDAAGNRSDPALLSAPTAPCSDASPPSSPAKLRLAYRTPTSISVTWGASSDNVGVTAYGAYADGRLVGTSTTESFTFANLECGRNHTLGVDATDASGNRSAQTTAMIATEACPDTVPPASPAVSVRRATTDSVSVSWGSATDNVAVAGYELWLQDRLVAKVSPRKRAHTFSGLLCGSTYATGVIAFDGAGNRSPGTTVSTATDACPAGAPTGDTTPPTAPAPLTPASVTSTSVTLAWPTSVDDVGVAEYGVYQGSTRIASTRETSHVLAGLTCGTSHQVAVDAADAAGNRSAKATATVATAPCGDTTAPSTPAGLQLMVAGETSVTIAWSPSSDNVGVTGYGIYVSNLLVMSTTSPNATLSALTCNSPYRVEVDAVDAAGNRSTRASLWVNTQACPDSTPPSAPTGLTIGDRTQTSLTLQWTASTDNVAVAGYTLRRNGVVTGTTSATTGVFSGLACSTSYTLDVTAYDAAGNRSTTASISATTTACPAGDTQPPTAPAGLAATGSSGTGITVGWSPSSDNVSVAGYGVYNGGVRIGTTSSTSYTVSGLSCGTTYALGVDAYDAAGNRSAVAPLSATTGACQSSSGSANLWIDANGGTCARQAQAGGYADAQACGSFEAAYTAAQSGDVVGVAAGSYPDQFFAGGYLASQGGGSKTLTFKGQPGNKIRALHFGSPNLTFDGLDVDAGGQRTNGAAFENGGAPFTFRNGRIGNVVDEKGALVTESGIVFENVVFHDVVLRTAGVHNECIWAGVPEGMIVRNSTFTNCAVMDIFFKYPDYWSPLPSPYGNVTLEGNTFGHPVGTYALYITIIGTSASSSAPVTGWKVRNNRFEGPVNSDAPYGSGNTFCGNTETVNGAIPASWKAAC